jgi:hypothetical protein
MSNSQDTRWNKPKVGHIDKLTLLKNNLQEYIDSIDISRELCKDCEIAEMKMEGKIDFDNHILAADFWKTMTLNLGEFRGKIFKLPSLIRNDNNTNIKDISEMLETMISEARDKEYDTRGIECFDEATEIKKSFDGFKGLFTGITTYSRDRADDILKDMEEVISEIRRYLETIDKRRAKQPRFQKSNIPQNVKEEAVADTHKTRSKLRFMSGISAKAVKNQPRKYT